MPKPLHDFDLGQEGLVARGVLIPENLHCDLGSEVRAIIDRRICAFPQSAVLVNGDHFGLQESHLLRKWVLLNTMIQS